MEQFFLLLVFLVFALGSHLMRLLRKRMEQRAPPPREARVPEAYEEELSWPWPQEPPPLPEQTPPPRVLAPAAPTPVRRPAPPPRAAAEPAPLPATARGPRRMQPRLSREEVRRGIVLREILGPCRGLEGMGSADRGGGA
ncbi:MAG: hypothetical protein AB1578_23365 [Thermodesulfobacteriota bacterium]